MMAAKHENDNLSHDDLKTIQGHLESLAESTKEFPIECEVGNFDFLFESRDDIELILDNVTEEIHINASKKAA